MKIDNNLFKVTKKDTGETRYFSKRQGVMLWTGIQASHQQLIERGLIKGQKGKNWIIELVDGTDIKWGEIDNV